jgi:arylformamidase
VYIDITFSINGDLPLWPGSCGFKYNWQKSMREGDVNNSSVLTIDSHFGTHLDAPLHFVAEGKSVADIPLEVLIGEVEVIEVSGRHSIGAIDIELALPRKHCTRLLLKTDNQFFWEEDKTAFHENFCGLNESAAQWIIDNGVKLIGIDYLSVQRFNDGPEVHQMLLQAGVVIVETLDLSKVTPGFYHLTCLPLKLDNLEASPVRAILKTIE